jgi:hypothetical protein
VPAGPAAAVTRRRRAGCARLAATKGAGVASCCCGRWHAGGSSVGTQHLALWCSHTV